MECHLDLPSEIWTSILEFLDVKSVAVFIPQVNKLFNHLSLDERLWRIKCVAKRLDFKIKKADETFKQFCLASDPPQLFPFLGMEIGHIATVEAVENNNHKKGVSSVTFLFEPNLLLRRISFYPGLIKDITTTEKLFKAFNNFERSWYDLLIFLRRKFGNYKMAPLPKYQPIRFSTFFTAGVHTIAMYKDVYYRIGISFKSAGKNELSTCTTSLVTIESPSDNATALTWAEQYHNRTLEPDNYAIPDDVLLAYKD